jgi:hypothetical protein
MGTSTYDFRIEHIGGTNNFFADQLSRSPVGMNPRQVAEIGKPTELSVAFHKLNVEPSVNKNLREIPTHQDQDPVT